MGNQVKTTIEKDNRKQNEMLWPGFEDNSNSKVAGIIFSAASRRQ